MQQSGADTIQIRMEQLQPALHKIITYFDLPQNEVENMVEIILKEQYYNSIEQQMNRLRPALNKIITRFQLPSGEVETIVQNILKTRSSTRKKCETMPSEYIDCCAILATQDQQKLPQNIQQVRDIYPRLKCSDVVLQQYLDETNVHAIHCFSICAA